MATIYARVLCVLVAFAALENVAALIEASANDQTAKPLFTPLDALFFLVPPPPLAHIDSATADSPQIASDAAAAATAANAQVPPPQPSADDIDYYDAVARGLDEPTVRIDGDTRDGAPIAVGQLPVPPPLLVADSSAAADENDEMTPLKMSQKSLETKRYSFTQGANMQPQQIETPNKPLRSVDAETSSDTAPIVMIVETPPSSSRHRPMMLVDSEGGAVEMPGEHRVDGETAEMPMPPRAARFIIDRA